ncbi:MAG TPA: penicillin-binding transpeptidase domain-containing protein [Steroidobacteraceae bacterium]|nr:penicillin-binding transpeptidase domain-containing protein [Steroidobacteraceae bacterium]
MINIRNNEHRAFTVEQFRGRLRWVLLVLLLAGTGLAARAVQLQLLDNGFLLSQGNARYTRIAKLAAHRGAIYDRNGETLAVSTPVDSVWVNPRELEQAADQIPKLAEALNRDRNWLAQRISSSLDRDFVYLVRHMNPEDAAQVKALNIPGVYLQREYRRYYPAGEVSSHVLGFTNIDDEGREGLELAYDHWLAGSPGAKRIIQDRYGRTVEDIESIRDARPGQDITTSIDIRIQYLAYRELKAAIQQHNAVSGSVVVVDVNTGEVLAMVNQPSYNPNDQEQRDPNDIRNRAATDLMEPGSIMKPFVATAGLETGRYNANTIIDTSPGLVKVGIKTIEDEHPLGAVTLTTVIAKSSNVGMTKLALSLSPESMWKTLYAFGFGQVTGSGFPGEAAGMLLNYRQWRPINQATISFGYSLSVTALQLAHAYAILGAGGISRPLTLQRVDGPVEGQRVIDQRIADEMVKIMESVVTEEGATGTRAAVVGYRVAGKTGTAQKLVNGSYTSDAHIASFGGVVPASHPRIACVVVINEPRDGSYYATSVSAPVFSNVASGALRLLAVPPDDLQDVPAATLVQTGVTP